MTMALSLVYPHPAITEQSQLPGKTMANKPSHHTRRECHVWGCTRKGGVGRTEPRARRIVSSNERSYRSIQQTEEIRREEKISSLYQINGSKTGDGSGYSALKVTLGFGKLHIRMKNLRDKVRDFFKPSKTPIITRPIVVKDPSWERGNPAPQPYYSFYNGAWKAIEPVTTSSSPTATVPSQLRLISWNIDAFSRFGPQRMAGALEHLEALYSDTVTAKAGPLVIFLQEMTVDDLRLITETDWIRKDFYITDPTKARWEDEIYGTTTLVEKRVNVERVFRVHYEVTRMGRDGLFFDIAIEPKVSGKPEESHTSEASAACERKIVRLCNTHLESMASGSQIRPTQLKTASRFLHAPTEGDTEPTSVIPAPHAGIVAGDLNAFAPEDAEIVPRNNLQDVYLSLGGEDSAEPGHTWVMQPLRESPVGRKPNGRLDKVLYCGSVSPKNLERIGVGLKIDAAKGLFELRAAKGEVGPEDEPFEQWTWVTDHLGLMADFELVDSSN